MTPEDAKRQMPLFGANNDEGDDCHPSCHRDPHGSGAGDNAVRTSTPSLEARLAPGRYERLAAETYTRLSYACEHLRDAMLEQVRCERYNLIRSTNLPQRVTDAAKELISVAEDCGQYWGM